MGPFAKYWDDKTSNEVVIKNITDNHSDYPNRYQQTDVLNKNAFQ